MNANKTLQDAERLGMPKTAARRRREANGLRNQINCLNEMYLVAEKYGIEYEMDRCQTSAMELATDLLAIDENAS